jgi:hypothetical protein
MHRGRVTVESLVGRGTTFTVTVSDGPDDPEPAVASVDEGVSAPSGPAIGATGTSVPAASAKMADSSPSPGPSLNVPRSG